MLFCVVCWRWTFENFLTLDFKLGHFYIIPSLSIDSIHVLEFGMKHKQVQTSIDCRWGQDKTKETKSMRVVSMENIWTFFSIIQLKFIEPINFTTQLNVNIRSAMFWPSDILCNLRNYDTWIVWVCVMTRGRQKDDDNRCNVKHTKYYGWNWDVGRNFMLR